MAFEVKIPSLGESVTEATLGRWLKQDGDAVSVDEPILELESDKANMELAAEATGKLKILTPAGGTVHFGDVVGMIEETAGAGAGAPAPRAAAPAAAPSGPAAASEKAPAPERPLSPAVRRIVEEERLDVSALTGSGPGGRILKADVQRLAEQRAAGTEAAPAPAGPLGGAAAAVAETPGAPRASVTSIAPARAAASQAAARATATAPSEADERVPMSRLRQVIAKRLVESQQTTATLTTFNEVDMSAILALRAQYRESFQKKHGVGLGFMSFFAAACCAAMDDVPEVNARIEGSEIVYHQTVHLGVAVGTERGLIVPVVRNADRMSFAEVEAEIARLAELARTNKLMPDDLAGATFTISNGGIYGSLLSTPILNPPQSAILGMHKIEKRPVVVDDQVVVRPMMYLALSYDHRLIDGRGAVTYLVRIKERLENPARLLLHV